MKGEDLPWLKYAIYMPKDDMRSYFQKIYKMKKNLMEDIQSSIK